MLFWKVEIFQRHKAEVALVAAILNEEVAWTSFQSLDIEERKEKG